MEFSERKWNLKLRLIEIQERKKNKEEFKIKKYNLT